MSSSLTVPPIVVPPIVAPPGGPARTPRIKPIYILLICTLFASAAQVLLKFAALHPRPPIDFSSPASVVAFIRNLIGDLQLMFGYSLHGCSAVLLILALRDGELSILMPVYALSYIWVNLLSLYFFHEDVNVWKVAGIILIIGGVSLLGKSSPKT